MELEHAKQGKGAVGMQARLLPAFIQKGKARHGPDIPAFLPPAVFQRRFPAFREGDAGKQQQRQTYRAN